MRMQRGEVLDRLSILLLKIVHEPINKQQFYEETIEYLKELASMDSATEVELPLVHLLDVNSRIWDLEAGIRNGDDLPDAEIGRRAKEIREFNKARISIKNRVNSYREIKIQHASE